MAEITKEFLEKALAKKISSFEINSGSNIGEGYTSLLYTIDVTLEEQYAEKLHLLLKCFPVNPMRQGFLSDGNVFKKELQIYDTIVPELVRIQLENKPKSQTFYELPFPQFFYGCAVDYTSFSEEDSKVCYNPLENCIIMADLRKTGGFKMANRFEGFDLDHCKLVIAAQAKLHALSWVYKQLTNTPSLKSKYGFLGTSTYDAFDEGMLYSMNQNNIRLFEESFKNCKDIGEEEKQACLKSLDRFKPLNADVNAIYYTSKPPKDSTRTKDNVLRVPQHLVENEEPWLVLTHGDAWLNNMLFRYDESSGKPLEVLFVDLQVTREADPFADVAYNLYTSTPAKLRKEHLDNFLQLYTNTFLQICEDFQVPPLPGFNLTEVKRRFHRAKAFGFSMAIIGLPFFVLNEAKDMPDMETVEGDGIEALMESLRVQTSNLSSSPNFIKRVTELVNELRVEGVI